MSHGPGRGNGLIPPPCAPNMITICHLMEPVIKAVAEFGMAPGIQIETFQYPFGVLTQVRVAPLIADLEATCKVAGFLNHSANVFCSFCHCTIGKHLEDLNHAVWNKQNGVTVCSKALQWKNLITKKAHKELETTTGV